MLGLPNAEELAYNTERWDTYIHKDYASLNYTWANRWHQINTHALTNTTHELEEFKSALMVLNGPLTNTKEMGRRLHRYGDSYAHSRMADKTTGIVDGSMYGKLVVIGSWDGRPMTVDYTVEHAFSPDKLEPDLIAARPDLYLKYVKGLAEVMAIKFDADEKALDYEKFQSMVDYAVAHSIDDNFVSLIGIINYEVAKQKDEHEFFVHFATGLIQDLDAHNQHIEDTKNYLENEGVEYETQNVYKDNGARESNMQYTGTKFTIKN